MQIIELYLLPAVRRQQESERRMKGLPPAPPEGAPPKAPAGPKPGTPAHRAMWERGFVEFKKLSPEAARAEYDRILKHGRKKVQRGG